MPHLDLAYTGPGIPVPAWNRLASPPDPWTTITFSPAADYSKYFDDGYHHSNGGGASFCNGDAFIHGSLVMRLEGMPVSQVQVRPYLIKADDSGERVFTDHALNEVTTDVDHNPAVTHYCVPIDYRVPAHRRLRLEVMQAHDSDDWPDGLIKWARIVARIDPI